MDDTDIDADGSEETDLELEAHFRKLIYSFYTSAGEECVDFGELLLNYSGTEKSADFVGQYGLVDVCEAILVDQWELVGKKKVSYAAGILANLIITAKDCKLINGIICNIELCFKIAMHCCVYEKAIPLCEILRFFIVKYSSSQVTSASTIDHIDELTILGEGLYRIHMCSQDPEVLAKTWHLCVLISLSGKERLSQFEKGRNFHKCFHSIESNLLEHFVLLAEGSSDGTSGLDWYFRFVDNLVSNSFFGGNSLLGNASSDEALNLLDSLIESLLQLIGTLTLTQKESFSLLCALDTMLISEYDCLKDKIEKAVTTNDKTVFSAFIKFVVDTFTDILLFRDIFLIPVVVRVLNYLMKTKPLRDEFIKSLKLHRQLIDDQLVMINDSSFHEWISSTSFDEDGDSIDGEKYLRDNILPIVNKLLSSIVC